MVSTTFWNASDFWLGDLPLNYIDDSGCRWMVEDVEGWWELPPPEIPDDARPYSDDGDYYVSGRYGPRTINIKGRILPPSNMNTSAVTDARDRMNAQLNSVRKPFVFRVDEPRYSKQAVVQIIGNSDITINDFRNQVEFSISLKASDPRKYYAELQNKATTLPGPAYVGRAYPRAFYYTYGDDDTDGTIHADNFGDYHTYGVVRISGPITNPSLLHVESNKTMKFNIVLAQGEFLDVNLRARTVKLNGKQFKRSSMTTDSKWFVLDSGLNSIKLFGTQHIAAVEGRAAATNFALNPSWEHSSIVNTSNYGASSVAHKATLTRQLRSTVDTTDNTGYVLAVKPNTPTSTDNVSFVVPSAQASSVAGQLIDPMSQGLYGGTTYTAMVDAIITKPFLGSFTTNEYFNYAINPVPLSDFAPHWSRLRFTDPLTWQDSGGPEKTVKINISNDTTKMVGSGIQYRQDKGNIPAGREITLTALVRSNKVVPIQPVIRWYNGNTLVRESFGSAVSARSAGEWLAVEVDATAPLTYTRIEAAFTVENISADTTWNMYDYFEMTNMMIQPSEQGSGFFSGAMENNDLETYTWTGTAGFSMSKRVEKVGGEDTLHEFARSLVFYRMFGDSMSEIDMESVVKAQIPNSPGEYQLRIEFTTPEDLSLTEPMYVSLWNGSPSASDIIYFDNFLLVEGSYSGKYFDGSSKYPGTSWSSTANLSASVQTAQTEIPKAEALIQYRSAWIH